MPTSYSTDPGHDAHDGHGGQPPEQPSAAEVPHAIEHRRRLGPPRDGDEAEQALAIRRGLGREEEAQEQDDHRARKGAERGREQACGAEEGLPRVREELDVREALGELAAPRVPPGVLGGAARRLGQALR
ncbi:hypothetical protein WME73_18160 [Sorangium sp. So ce302]